MFFIFLYCQALSFPIMIKDMTKKSPVIAAIYLALFSFSLWSQQTGVFTPFISRLKAESRGTAILLSWKDTQDVSGDYLIFRSTEEITEENFISATQVGIVESGKQQFTDYPYDLRQYYYLVLCRDDQTTYEQFIPFRNKTITPVSAEYLAQESDRAAVITNISTTINDDYVRLEFDVDKPERELIIYRSTNVIAFEENLLTSTVISIQPGTKTFYIDYAVPGVGYYYAVFDADLIKSGVYRFSPEENITLRPMEIAISREAITETTETSRRSLPLPLLILPNEISSGIPLASSIGLSLPERQKLNPQSETIISQLISWLPEKEEWDPRPIVLPEEEEEDLSGARRDLQEIIQNQFANSQWLDCETNLQLFLRTRRDSGVENRSRFYLGQCYYFKGELEKALIEWLYIREDLYTETAPWIYTVFRQLKKQSES